jgi:Bacterial antitoxin of ParD toxin-antitoxin type II system and RHH
MHKLTKLGFLSNNIPQEISFDSGRCLSAGFHSSVWLASEGFGIKMTAMNVILSPRRKQFVQREVKTGRFENATDSISAGLRLLEQRDRLAGSLGPNTPFAVAWAIRI